MQDVVALPAPQANLAVTTELHARAERQMLAPARRGGYELRLLGATVLPQRQVIARTQAGTWIFCDSVADPTAVEYGGRIPIPHQKQAELLALRNLGVDPDLIWLGHEVPEGYREGDRVPVPAPAHLREKDERLIRGMDAVSRLLMTGAAAVAAAPLALLSAGAGLDPIVFGGVRHRTEPVVAWAALCSWTWE